LLSSPNPKSLEKSCATCRIETTLLGLPLLHNFNLLSLPHRTRLPYVDRLRHTCNLVMNNGVIPNSFDSLDSLVPPSHDH